MAMYLKVGEESSIYGELYDVFATDNIRNINFIKWQRNNLPEFKKQVLTQRSIWWLHPITVGWKFVGEVDAKTWKPVKGFEGYYEPNLRTKAGKQMNMSILIAQGQRFNRMKFFQMFKTKAPYGRELIVPHGFAYRGICYMVFDDLCYRDIQKNMAGQYEEITREEFEAALNASNTEAILKDL